MLEADVLVPDLVENVEALHDPAVPGAAIGHKEHRVLLRVGDSRESRELVPDVGPVAHGHLVDDDLRLAGTAGLVLDEDPDLVEEPLVGGVLSLRRQGA